MYPRTWVPRYRVGFVAAGAFYLFSVVACAHRQHVTQASISPASRDYPAGEREGPSTANEVASFTFPRTEPPLFGRSPLFRNSYAIVIGVGRYSNSRWKYLANATKDAQSVGFLLAQQGFYIRYLGDEQATKQEILKTLEALRTSVRRGDRILIFFAGHGYTEGEPGSEAGYVVPHDGNAPETMISMDEVYKFSAGATAAQQILWIMDACYSGLVVTRGVEPNPLAPDYIEQISRRPSRQVITAGGKDQEVTDTGPDGHSFFTGAFLKALLWGRADLNRDQYVTFSELAAYLQTCGSNRFQTPGLGTLPGHKGGDFIFNAGSRQQVTSNLLDCSAPPKAKSPCDRNGDGEVNQIDVQISIGQALGSLPCTVSTLAGGSCNVVDVQRVINASLGQACRAD